MVKQMLLLSLIQQKVGIDSSYLISVELRNFIADLQYFESFYPGGLESYVTKGRELLMKSSRKENPMEGYVPSVGYSDEIRL